MNKKKFDCVEMKREIQQEILKEMSSLSPEEQRRRTEEQILSDPLLAPFWQKARRSPLPTSSDSHGPRT